MNLVVVAIQRPEPLDVPRRQDFQLLLEPILIQTPPFEVVDPPLSSGLEIDHHLPAHERAILVSFAVLLVGSLSGGDESWADFRETSTIGDDFLELVVVVLGRSFGYWCSEEEGREEEGSIEVMGEEKSVGESDSLIVVARSRKEKRAQRR